MGESKTIIASSYQMGLCINGDRLTLPNGKKVSEGKKILIIDDDMTALDIVDFLFEDKGFTVIRGSDGVNALEVAAAETPDVILIDLMMPRMSGQDCVKELRKRGVSIPIVAFTALDDPEVHQEALSAGCNLVLTKPCKPAVLVKHIEELLRTS